MKEILLGVTSMVSEVFLCERAKPGGVQSSRSRKILFPQDSLDPDIDRECAQALVGKEHHAISNLCAHARQLAQSRAKIDIRKRGELFKIDIAACDQSRGCEQIFSAITKRALPKLLFRRRGDSLRRWERVHKRADNLAWLPKPFPQLLRNLPNVRDLFHRRTNKHGQTFPLRLTDNSQTSAKLSRGIHRRIIWKRRANFGQRMIK